MRELRRLNAWVNNRALRDVDARIITRAITEETPQADISYGANPGRDGQRILGRQRLQKRVAIEFAIRELYDLAARTAIIDAVNTWAADGVLQVSTRPGQRMNMICVRYATAENVRDYTSTYRVEFEADAIPYWQEDTPAGASGTGTAGTLHIVTRGNAETVAEAVVTPTAGPLTTLAIRAQNGEVNNRIAFTGLDVAAGTKIVLDHDTRGFFRATAGGTSILSRRTAPSADELICQPGLMTVTYATDAACAIDVTIRGRWR